MHENTHTRAHTNTHIHTSSCVYGNKTFNVRWHSCTVWRQLSFVFHGVRVSCACYLASHALQTWTCVLCFCASSCVYGESWTALTVFCLWYILVFLKEIFMKTCEVCTSEFLMTCELWWIVFRVFIYFLILRGVYFFATFITMNNYC